jgi:hypothetical protein
MKNISKILVSLIFLSIFLIRIFMPNIKIDSLSIVIVLLAIVPWFIQYVKALEINGIGKVDLVDKAMKNEIEQKADSAGIENIPPKAATDIQITYDNLRNSDPKLALAGLRIEIENSLRKIAAKNMIDVNRKGIWKMTQILGEKQLIDDYERALILDMTGILNKAVHSQIQEYDDDSIDWAFNMGFKILNSLEQKAE